MYREDDATVAYIATNPNARYIQDGYGAFSTAGRNTEPTSPINNIDVTAMKRFNLNDRWRIEFAGQIYNLLNHAQFVPGFVNDIQPTTHSAYASVTSFVP